MSDQPIDSRWALAISELRDYLSDLIPPLIVADSIEELFQCPLDLVAANINSWVAGQYRSAKGLPKSDYLFHALKKIHMMGEYKLVPQKELSIFLAGIRPHILSYCPPGEQELLLHSLQRMGDAIEPSSNPVEVMYRQTAGAGATQSISSEGTPGLQTEVSRIGQMLQRIKKDLQVITRSGESVPEEKQEEVLAQVLAQTARSARASIELEEALEHIKSLGIQAGTEDIFRALGRSLPEWSLAPRSDLQMPEDSNLKAMHRIVTETKDPKEGATRFHQMVRAAIERLNEGHLQAAVNMIDLAEKIIAAKEVDHNVVENLRKRGHEDVDMDHLRKYSESTDHYPLLKKVLSFFDALNPMGLLESLRTEAKRERRRLLLSLLESHGDATRKVVISVLRGSAAGNFSEEECYFRRNLLYLLRRTPSSPEDNSEELLRIVTQHTDLDLPIIVAKEAVACLGQIKNREAEEVLRGLLAETESRLVASKNSDDIKKFSGFLDRLAASLARLGTPGARKALLDHALSRKHKWGNTVGRLSELAGQDLSGDPVTVNRLLTALNSSLPRKVLGFVVQQKDFELQTIVEALVSTNTPEVRNALEDLRRRFPESNAAQAAVYKPPAPVQETQATPSEQKPAVAQSASSLNGDLDLFGLPGLFQSLGDHQLTGTLSLRSPAGSVFATADFLNGKLIACEAGKLSGETGVYQLLERPQPGTFQFTRNAVKEESFSREILPVLMEGIRRYDEFRQFQAILPDDARVIGTGVKPTVLPEEKDGLLFRDLWNAVREGTTPQQCESKIASDSYRIRRLLVHWLETGSISNL